MVVERVRAARQAIIGWMPSWLRNPRAQRWLYAAGGIAAYAVATVAVLTAIYAPHPSPEQRLAALLCAPSAMIPALWRSARLSAGEPGAALLRWRRLDCLLVGYLLGAIAIACSVAAVSLMAIHGSSVISVAIGLVAAGGGAVLALSYYYVLRLRPRPA